MLAKPLIIAVSMGWLTFTAGAMAQQPVPPPAPPVAARTAASTEPSELVQIRKQYTTRALAASRILSDQYTKALGGLERDYGMAGDYDQALAAQQRRLELMTLYSNVLDDTSFANVIVLKPADARLNGSVTYDKAQDALTGWKTAGSVASWDVSRLTPGTYSITLRYGVADFGEVRYTSAVQDTNTGGDFEFYEDSSLSGAAANRRPATVTTTGGWTTLATLEMPPFQLGRTTARFSLRITKPRGGGGVMLLRDIRLAPMLAPKPAVVAGGVSAQEEYTNLRNSHTEILKQAAMPVITAYHTKLTQLVEMAMAKNEGDLGEDLRAEQRRLQKMMETPSVAQLGKFMSSDRKLFNSGNEEWRDVKFVNAPTNTGDRFMVSYQDVQMKVKLIGVSCPPHSNEVTPALKAYADYFGISTEDAAALATQARDFTLGFLKDKSLRLLSRGVTDKEGVIPVTVQLDGIGDFTGVLVDNGLVAIDTGKNRAKPMRRGEEALLNALRDREAIAKTRPIALGAWAMKADDAAPAK